MASNCKGVHFPQKVILMGGRRYFMCPLSTRHSIIEQDHRAIRRVARPMLGFKAFDTAQSTLTGIELMPMLRKGQLEGGSGAQRGQTMLRSGSLRGTLTEGDSPHSAHTPQCATKPKKEESDGSVNPGRS